MGWLGDSIRSVKNFEPRRGTVCFYIIVLMHEAMR